MWRRWPIGSRNNQFIAVRFPRSDPIEARVRSNGRCANGRGGRGRCRRRRIGDRRRRHRMTGVGLWRGRCRCRGHSRSRRRHHRNRNERWRPGCRRGRRHDRFRRKRLFCDRRQLRRAVARHQSLPNRVDPLLIGHGMIAPCGFDVRERLGDLHARFDLTHRLLRRCGGRLRRRWRNGDCAHRRAHQQGLDAAVASGSTAPQVFSKVSTRGRTRIRRVAASTFLLSMETMPARRVWQAVSGGEIGAINRIGAGQADRDRP